MGAEMERRLEADEREQRTRSVQANGMRKITPGALAGLCFHSRKRGGV